MIYVARAFCSVGNNGCAKCRDYNAAQAYKAARQLAELARGHCLTAEAANLRPIWRRWFSRPGEPLSGSAYRRRADYIEATFGVKISGGRIVSE